MLGERHVCTFLFFVKSLLVYCDCITRKKEGAVERPLCCWFRSPVIVHRLEHAKEMHLAHCAHGPKGSGTVHCWNTPRKRAWHTARMAQTALAPCIARNTPRRCTWHTARIALKALAPCIAWNTARMAKSVYLVHFLVPLALDAIAALQPLQCQVQVSRAIDAACVRGCLWLVTDWALWFCQFHGRIRHAWGAVLSVCLMLLHFLLKRRGHRQKPHNEAYLTDNDQIFTVVNYSSSIQCLFTIVRAYIFAPKVVFPKKRTSSKSDSFGTNVVFPKKRTSSKSHSFGTNVVFPQ